MEFPSPLQGGARGGGREALIHEGLTTPTPLAAAQRVALPARGREMAGVGRKDSLRELLNLHSKHRVILRRAQRRGKPVAMTTNPDTALRALLDAAGWPAADAARVRFSGDDTLYPCRTQAGVATGVALAAAGLALPGPARRLHVDLDHAALMSEGYRHVRLDGASVAAPRDALTGFYATRDGRALFLHVNFPHHRARALAVLGAIADRESIAAQIRLRDIGELDAALAKAGAIAAPALSFAEWDASPQGAAIARLPLLEIARIGDAPQKPFRDIRVIDFTRVLAGPTCGRFLAEAGAVVTRIEHPQTPDLIAYKLDANRDKQERNLDLRAPDDLASLRAMAARANVFVQAYRPGVAAQFGLDPQTLCAAHPGLICASLSAYGHEGPWSQRRGFDSVIQSACGLADMNGNGVPKLLPTSPLDYAAGFLLAFGVEVALHRRAREGGSYLVRTSLA
ncbi:MAG: carnitine dehydratase, partial [Hyphomicrobiales bacterium]|nr:carnitine dehydratase [Hyphomicrobiales bacterium]